MSSLLSLSFVRRTAHLGVRDEMHIQGTYKTDFSLSSHEITFNVTKESYFRAYVAPLEFDVDLWLYLPNPNLPPIVRFS